MKEINKLTQAVRLALFASVIAVPTMASAADIDDVEVKAATSQGEEVIEEEVERISVTGSRIRRSELSLNTPVFTFDAEDMAVRGFTNAADMLNQSPLFGGSQTPAGAQDDYNAGQNQVNLFDLGTQRTLTLVNGKRLVTSQSATGGGSQVDINTIPAALIERIETVPLTGAATYGADAIAGTVNIILKDDYEGFEISTQYGNNEAGNAKTFQISTLGGANFSDGRGNITFGMEYTKDDGLLDCDQGFLCEDNWEFDSTQLEYVDLNGDGQADDVNGDGVIDVEDQQSINLGYQERRLALFTQYGAVSQTGAGFLGPYAASAGYGGFPDGKAYEFTQNGDLIECTPGPTQARSIMTVGDDVCGIDFFDSVGQIRSPTSRFNTYASFTYEFSDTLMLKQDFLYANTKGKELVNQGGFQTGFFGGTSAALTMSMDNPFLSDQARQTMVDSGYTEDTFSVHRFNNDLIDLGGNSNETQVWRITNSLMGEFSIADKDFYWDVSVVHGKSDILTQTTGIIDGRFLNAIDARTIDDAMLEQIRLQDPNDATDDLADLNAAMLALQGANGGDTANFQAGDTICGAFADLAANTLTGFNSRASGSGLVDEDIPFLDGCTPLNLFGSQASAESLAFITGGDQLAASDNTQTVYTANLGGSLMELPAGYLDFVVGTERRIEKGNYQPSVGLRVPITRSSIDTPVVGGFETEEYYVEFVAPLISSDMNIPFVQALEFSGAYRYQDFTTDAPVGFEDRTTDADVYQASLKWQVNNDLALRGTVSSAFRNPSIQELFQPASQAFINGDDPCDARSVGLGPNPTARKANCEAAGIDTSTFVSSIQDGTISGGIVTGNSELEPETNESYSYGLIYTPDYIEGLQVAIDYYNVEIVDSIESVTFEDNAAVCYDSNDMANEEACDTFVRDADNQVISVVEGPRNVALSTFESVTMRVFYEFDLGEMGALSVDAFTQHNITNEFKATVNAETEEDVGDYADPDWIGTVDTTWTYNDFLISHRVRWQSTVKIDTLDQNLYATQFEQLDDEYGTYVGNFTNETGTRFINDLSARYFIDDSMSVQLNVLNLLDRKPDENAAMDEAAGFYGLDEELGRRFSIRFNAKF